MMVSVEVPVVIGEQFVEAARKVVADATASFRNVGEYHIGADVDFDGNEYVYVQHVPCTRWIFGVGEDLRALDAAELLKLIAKHRCEVPNGD